MKPKLVSLAVATTALGASAVAQSASLTEPNRTGNFTYPAIDFTGPIIPRLVGISVTGVDYGKR